MDPTRFDELTKALATSTSRRQALKTIAATTIGGILGLGGLGTAFGAPKCHRNGLGCDTNDNCCSHYCANGKCTCPPAPACNDTCPCPTGQTCQNGQCITPCIPNGEGLCFGNGDCCSQICDRSILICVSCVPNGDYCDSDSECCSKHCSSNNICM